MKRLEKKSGSAGWKTGMLCLILLLVFGVSFCVGRYPVSPAELLEWIGTMITGNRSDISEESQKAALVLMEVRAARIFAAMMIGAGLSAAGAAYQGIFRNPMVSPDILGAATGASFGSALAILLGAGAAVIQASSFCFGLAAVTITFFVSQAMAGRGGSATMTLVLTGMVVSALFSAFISIIKYIGDPYDTLPAITYIQMGGLTYVTAADLPFMLAPFLAGILPLILLRWRMNIMSFEEEEAASLGVDTAKTRAAVILCATLVSSSSVAVGGMIGWVGLIIPHAARMIAGADYSRMLPVSMLAGGAFLLLVDDAARSFTAQEIPLGVLTAVLGAPLFLYLMFRGRKSFL